MTATGWLRRALPLIVPWLAAAAMAAFAYSNVLTRMPPLQADEAGHALPGARMALALRAGDVPAFASATRGEIHWPFLHPWLLCLAFLAFGIKAEVARAVSLAALVAVLGLLPCLARELSGRRAPPLLGWLSVAALLATPDCWLFACGVMSETLGMLWTVVALWLGARAVARARPWPQALAAGGVAAAAFLTKYNYGAPLALALTCAPLVQEGRRGLKRAVAAGLGFGLPVALWLAWQLAADPSRWELILGMVTNRDEGLRGIESLVFYPRALSERVGPVVSVVTALALARSAWRRTRALQAGALIFAAVTLALLTWHPNKQWRYALPLLPVLLVLAEVEVVALLGRWPRAVGPACLLATSLLLAARAPLDTLLDDSRAGEVPRAASRIVGFAADEARACRTVLVLGSTGLLPHSAVAWELLERSGRETRVEPLDYPGQLPWDSRYRQGYPAELTPLFAPSLARALSEMRPDCVVSLELARSSPFLPGWLARWDAWGQNYVQLMLRQPGFEVGAQWSYPTESATVRVYRPAARP